MCEHDDTNVCMRSNARPHTFAHKYRRMQKDKKKKKRHRQKVKGLQRCVLLSDRSTHSYQKPEDARLSHLLPGLVISDQKEFQPCGGFLFFFFYPQRPLLPRSVVVRTFTVEHLHLESALHFLLILGKFNNAQLCFRRAVLYSHGIKGAQHCQLWFTPAQLYGWENLNTPVYYAV